MSAKEMRFDEAFNGPSVVVFGNHIADLAFTDQHATHLGVSDPQGRPRFARVVAYRFGAAPCVHLPHPILLLVFGDGEELAQSECGLSPGSVRKWTFAVDAKTVALQPAKGSIDEMLEEYASRGIDGGLTFENPRYVNGQLCVDAHVWAKISVLGQTAKFDQRIPICINIGQPCITVWDIGFANLQICYRDPNQICGKLCVGKFGLEKCWEQCVRIPIADQLASQTCHCSSSGTAASISSSLGEECIKVTIHDGKACLHVPIAGDVCVNVPNSIPNGTLAEACFDVCKKFGVPCGVKVVVRVAGQEVASQKWGCC